jgi:4-amino-4-deoxy-L-arabinose transferase-like glycosyltransferase
MAPMRNRGRQIAAWYGERPLALDASLLAAVTLIAAVLRLVKLGDIPYGVHPDEAQIGTDAFRISADRWIGVYSHAALGVPTLNAYLTWPAIWLLGHTAFSLRLPLALTGLAAVPLLYFLVRVSYGRIEAFFASLLLAISFWHLFYSRVAHSSISYPTILLAAALCIMLGLKRGGRRLWFLAGGVLLGLGVYAYNVDAIAIVAIAAFFAIVALLQDRRSEQWRRFRTSMAVTGASALIVALPFIWYVSDPGAYYWEHIDDYRSTGVLRSQEYHDAGPYGKMKVIGDQLRDFASSYAWDGHPDIIDANGLRPMFDPVFLVLLATGAIIAYRRRREPMVILAACCIAVLPLPALLQRGSMMREPLGAAPYVMFIAALPLAALWRTVLRANADPGVRSLAAGVAVACTGIILGLTVHDYFWTWRTDQLTRYVYHSEMTSASLYMRTLPADAYVYFYSERHPLYLETRTFLAPGVQGEDRSREFSDRDGSIEDIDRTRTAEFVLLGDYLSLLPRIEARYPGGIERKVTRDGKTEFYAYELGARDQGLGVRD